MYIYPPKEWFDALDTYGTIEKMIEENESLEYEIDTYTDHLMMYMCANPVTFVHDAQEYSQQYSPRKFSLVEYMSIQIENLIWKIETNLEILRHNDICLNVYEDQKDEVKPYVYINCNRTYSTEYEIDSDISDYDDSIKRCISRLKMWAVMDKPSLAGNAIEAKDKTKYIDDKIEFTDIVSHFQTEFRNEINFLREEIENRFYLKTLKEFFSTAEKE